MKDIRHEIKMPEENARKLIKDRLRQGIVRTISGKDVGDGELKQRDDIPGEYIGTRLNHALCNLFKGNTLKDREWESVWTKGDSGETFSGIPFDTWSRHVTYHIPSDALIEYGIAYSGDRSFEQVRVYGKTERDTTTLVERIMEEVKLLTKQITNGEK